ncbi:MAG: exodeoxyribonuclease VII large subunit [Vicinamibacterales bacterium]
MSSLFDLPFEEPEPEPVHAGAPLAAESPLARRVLTIAQLTAKIRVLLEGQFADTWVEGEISNCRLWNTGHLYFTLKDTGAQIKAVMFRSALRYLKFKPQDGLRVVARGRVSLYDPKGEYQLVCEYLEPEGLGARQLAFEQLKARLAREGLFAPERKRALPVLPRKIGVVTSLDGAAIRDIIKVLRRRYANAHIIIRPTRVQGDSAELDIARAITAIGRVRGVDVVIVGRGGGSAEDLWSFNEEVVARALAGCPVPTISAVGHESDVTIADFVADLRAPTPSAAAELVVARKDDFVAGIDRLSRRLDAVLDARLHRLESRLRGLEARPGLGGFPARLAGHGRRTADRSHELRRALNAGLAARERRYRTLQLKLEGLDVRRQFQRVRTRLVSSDASLRSAIVDHRHRAQQRFLGAAARLESLSPLAVLGRGYAVCWNADRTAIVRSAASVNAGERVQVTLREGELTCDVVTRTPARPANEA